MDWFWNCFLGLLLFNAGFVAGLIWKARSRGQAKD